METQGLSGSNFITNWFGSQKTETPQETELEKLKKGSLFNYAKEAGAYIYEAQQAGAYMG